MSMIADPRLQRLLGGVALAGLRSRLRQRYTRGATAPFRLSGLSDAERAALANLLGQPPSRAGAMTLDIGELDAALRRAGIAASLRDALEQLDGPIVARAAARAATRAHWDELRVRCGDARLAALLAHPRGLSLAKRLARSPVAAEQLTAATLAVLRALPAAGIPRARLAAEVLGDAHGLDPGRPIAGLVLAALRLSAEIPEEPSGAESPDAGADVTRDVWAEAGVLVDELAHPALFLNLPAADGQPFGMAPGAPHYLSLRTLLRTPPRWDVAGRDIRICQNPNLVAHAADALGAHCAPLVCIDGMPDAAQRTLLRQLDRAGAHLHYHGDFDWDGLAIANWIMRNCGARPWRYGAVDYLTAIRKFPVRGPSLGPDVVHAEWDAGLAQAMLFHDQAIGAEAIVAVLILDLAGPP